ncbi:MAG: RuvX/YqgF family protein [bacterium]
MKILCVDYGVRNLGFATAETPFATPLSVAHVDSMGEAIIATTKVVDQFHPDYIVVGIPEGEIATLVMAYVTALKPLFQAQIVTHPETLSSQEAVIKLREAGASRAKFAKDHAFAACLILEDYLDANPNLVKI